MSEQEINAIYSEIKTLRENIVDAKKRLAAAELRNAGLKVGDRIIIHDRKGDRDAVVTGWDIGWSISTGKPACVVARKDGTAGQKSAGYIDKWSKKDAAK